MKHFSQALVFAAILFFATTSMAGGLDIYKKSAEVKPFFNSAYGYAFFPNIGKGGFGLGLAYGEGQVYKRGVKTGTVSLIKGTAGFQFGGQVFSELIFFEDKRAYDEFTGGQFEFDAAASVALITAGTQASTGTKGATASASAGPATGKQAKSKAKFQKGIRVFMYIKGGLMYEATIGGQKFFFTPNK